MYIGSKFDTRLAERIYGCEDESVGDVDTLGHYARHGARLILHTDSQGFVYTYRYATREDCDRDWETILADYDELEDLVGEDRD